jgi:hypothetical protein
VLAEAARLLNIIVRLSGNSSYDIGHEVKQYAFN